MYYTNRLFWRYRDMASGGIATIAGVGGMLGGWGAANAERDAMNAAAAAQMQLGREQLAWGKKIGKPFMDASAYAMPKMRNLARYQFDQIGKEDPNLKAGLEQSFLDIGRNTDMSKAIGINRFASVGNDGAATGSVLRANRAAMEDKNKAILSYGVAQQGFKQQNLGNYQNTLNIMGQLGLSGTQVAAQTGNQAYETMANSIGVKAKGQADYFSSKGGFFGDMTQRSLDYFAGGGNFDWLKSFKGK